MCQLPRYFFNVVAAAGSVDDDEGTELASLEAARAEALDDARALMSDAIRGGSDISGRHIDICDSAGAVLMTVEFAEAITRRD